jgi:opacity protein-like surface antigen
MKIHNLAWVSSILLALGSASVACADDLGQAPATGFYGGLSLRERAVESAGLSFGAVNPAWNRFVAPTADDASSRALVFGGYRWRNDIAVEAAFNSLDKYALRPAGSVGARGVGLSFPPALGIGDLPTRSWNVDLFTSWTFYKSLALYGRMGYAQTDTTPLSGTAALSAPDIRRLRDGVNYGVGLRYDMNSTLGLRVEYGRFGRFAGEWGSGLAESDQLSLGVQLRF